jgi:hypothetical protein
MIWETATGAVKSSSALMLLCPVISDNSAANNRGGNSAVGTLCRGENGKKCHLPRYNFE